MASVLYRKKYFFIFITIIGLISGCSPDYSKLAAERLEYAREDNKDITVVAMDDSTQFLSGVILASEIINSHPEKLLNKELKIIVEQEQGSFEESKKIINRTISNPHVVAVLGHRKSKIAVPASAVYERGQVVFISSFATAKSLTSHDFKYIFRFLPGNDNMVAQLANAARTLGYKRLVILYSRDDFNRELAFLFEDAALKEGMELVKRSSFFQKDTNYRPIISQFNDEQFDAVFIAADGASAGLMVQQLREMGLDHPIVGTDSLNSSTYVETAGQMAANNTIVPAIYDANSQNPLTLYFRKKYAERFNEEPDLNAAQGFDAMMILASAIRIAQSTLGPSLSSTMHFMPPWVGVTGIHSFDQAGDLAGKKFIFKTWRQNKLRILPALHSLYLLERFEQNTGNPGLPLSTAFSQLKHDNDHKVLMLSLAHEVLKFERIGIIFEDTPDGRQLANRDLLERLSQERGVKIVDCIIPFSLLDQTETKKSVVACYGKLSLSVDVLFAPSQKSILPDLLDNLNKSLSFFKIPILSIDRDTMSSQTTLGLSRRTDVNKKNIAIYNGLLHNIKVHEFLSKLKGIPDISVNVNNLEAFNRSMAEVVLLSPDNFLSSDKLISDE